MFKLCDSFGEAITRDELVSLFVSLIKDSEGEVKVVTIAQAPGKKKREKGEIGVYANGK